MNDAVPLQKPLQSNAEQGYGLSETAYSFGYILRQKYSSLKQAALDWFSKKCPNLLPINAPKILNLGCGNGMFDIELIKTIMQKNLLMHIRS